MAGLPESRNDSTALQFDTGWITMGKNRRGKNGDNPPERQLTVEQMEKMAGNILDRNGKPVDFRISSGFDLKI